MNVYASFLYKKGLQAIHNQSLEVDPLLVGLEGALEDVYIRSMLACEELRGYYYSISYTPPVGFDWVPICELMEEKRAAACGRVLNNGNRQYLFMFPISETNLAMTPAFMMLLENACKLSSPPSIPQTCYAVGESVEITLKQNAQSPIVTSSDGTVTELNRINTTFIPTAPGVYTLTYDYNNQTREASFFVHISVEEYETYSADTIYLSKTFERNTEGETLFNTMLPSVAVILSALLIFEWGYHYRGKY